MLPRLWAVFKILKFKNNNLMADVIYYSPTIPFTKEEKRAMKKWSKNIDQLPISTTKYHTTTKKTPTPEPRDFQITPWLYVDIVICFIAVFLVLQLFDFLFGSSGGSTKSKSAPRQLGLPMASNIQYFHEVANKH
jgi:hypothetical protein